MSDAAFFWGGIGLCLGLIISHWLWRWTIEGKAASGFRLEVGGRLYNVSNADNQGEKRA